ncbi:MAG TPA: hypothetical protein VJI15_06345 [Candidatus Nanoarchaeia archaeon]|nr:hypothetical protein [Candidatus Nanoarchaeia archaeon]
MKSGNKSFFLSSSKRGDISLSVNFLVIIMISLVVFGMGVTILYKIVDGSLDKKAELDARTEQELQRLLIDEGKRVALPFHIADIIAGESHIFGIGILNVEAENDHFRLEITLDKAVNLQGEDISSDVEVKTWLLYLPTPLKIEQGRHHTEPIGVDVPGNAPKGKYLFNVQVLRDSDGTLYGNTQKMIVNVI